MSSLPLTTFLVFGPLATAALTLRRPGLDHARRVAVAGNLTLTLVATLAGVLVRLGRAPMTLDAPLDVAWLDASPALGPLRFKLGLDPLAILAVPVLAATLSGIFVSAPRRALGTRAIRLMLGMEATCIASLAALDGATLALSWLAWAVLGAASARDEPAGTRGAHPHARAHAIYVGGTVVAIGGGVATLFVAGADAGLREPLDFASLASVRMSPRVEDAAFCCFAIAVLTRMGVAPLHSWIPAMASRGSLPKLAVHFAAPVGISVLLRVVSPLLPGACRAHLGSLFWLALASAVYMALVGLAQHDLRRAVVFVRASLVSLVLVGACVQTEESAAAAAVFAIVLAVTTPALLGVIAGIEARLGSSSMKRAVGIVASAPFAVGAWALMSMATVGFPGTIGFVAEELLLGAVLRRDALAAFVLALVMGLNGVTLFVALFRGLLGAPPRDAYPTSVADFTRRERLPLVVAFTLLVVTGAAPEPLFLLEHGLDAPASSDRSAPRTPSHPMGPARPRGESGGASRLGHDASLATRPKSGGAHAPNRGQPFQP